MSGFFVSTAWPCVYLQNFATEFQSSKVNLPKYFETSKNRCFTTYADFVSLPLIRGVKKKRILTSFRSTSKAKELFKLLPDTRNKVKINILEAWSDRRSTFRETFKKPQNAIGSPVIAVSMTSHLAIIRHRGRTNVITLSRGGTGK